MRITRLYLKNFAHIYSGLNKYEIDLDLSINDKLLNLIIGQMGTCKSVILGHLQPFHSFGTLDIRNQDSIILDGMDGLKIIEYVDGLNEYKITHKYTWNRNTHSVKCYIEKNGEELNENGNQNSFRDIISAEFGIEQSYLRLLRLGPNVANVIDMKSTERKSFIASLLNDAEIYSLLYKKWSDDFRSLNSQITVISNKLNMYSNINEDDYASKIKENTVSLNNLNSEIEELKRKKYSIEANIDHILKGESIDRYIKNIKSLEDKRDNLLSMINSNKSELEKYSGIPSLEELSNRRGELNGLIMASTNRITELDRQYKILEEEYLKLVDNQKTMGDPNNIKLVKSAYDELLINVKEYECQLTGFECKYTTSQLKSAIEDVKAINVMIDELSQYNKDIIKLIYRSDESCKTYAKKQIDILSFKKMKIQKEINNLKFAKSYSKTTTMYIPPFCPTTDCPFYRTHPVTLNLNKSEKKIDKELTKYMEECDALDAKIYAYSDFPYIYSKLVSLKEAFHKVVKILHGIDAVNYDNLLSILINLKHRVWYNHDRVMKYIELSEKRDLYYELSEKLVKIKHDMNQLSESDYEHISEKIADTKNSMDSISDEINTLSINIKNYNNEITDIYGTYLSLEKKDELQKNIDSDVKEYQEIYNTLLDMTDNINIISTSKSDLDMIDHRINEYSRNASIIMDDNDKLKMALNDIEYNKAELENIMMEKKYLGSMLDAVSPKKGIPLIFVKLFLANCKDIINELISDVFGDKIEILDFDITETDFKIPYMLNGQKVDDIQKASQGQKSIISIALSFALIRQGSFKYNIMTLDEVDGPLYKNDRNKFIDILFKQIKAIGASQVFLISHNNTFEGYNVNVIMTTDEVVDNPEIMTVIKV